jgi:hypothetical protein
MRLTLDAEHHYWKEDEGRREEVPGVTSILKATGVDGQYYSNPWKTKRGTYLHEASHLLHLGTLDLSTVDPSVAPFLLQLEDFDRLMEVEVLSSELIVYSKEGNYAGTLDRVCTMVDRPRPLVMDLKTGSRQWWHSLQVCAYCYAHAGEQWSKYDVSILYLSKTNYRLQIIEGSELDFSMGEWKALLKKYHEGKAYEIVPSV